MRVCWVHEEGGCETCVIIAELTTGNPRIIAVPWTITDCSPTFAVVTNLQHPPGIEGAIVDASVSRDAVLCWFGSVHKNYTDTAFAYNELLTLSIADRHNCHQHNCKAWQCNVPTHLHFPFLPTRESLDCQDLVTALYTYDGGWGSRYGVDLVSIWSGTHCQTWVLFMLHVITHFKATLTDEQLRQLGWTQF